MLRIFRVAAFFSIIAFSLAGKVDIDLGGEIVARYTWDSCEIYPNNEFALRRIRPKIKIDAGDGFSGKISFELKNEVAELRDAMLEWKMSRALEIGAGRRRKPFGIDETMGMWEIPGVDYSAVHGVMDDTGYLDRDIGFWLAGKFFREPFLIEYDLGLYNGHGGYDPKTSEKQFAGMLIYSPHSAFDIVFSGGLGMDTLGLKWCGAWGIGGILRPDSIPVELAAEYATGKDIYTGESNILGQIENNICGQIWLKYSFWKFTPFIQYEFSNVEFLWVDNDPYFDPLFERWPYENKRTHFGLIYEPIDKIRLKLQAGYIDDYLDEAEHAEIVFQVHARF